MRARGPTIAILVVIWLTTVVGAMAGLAIYQARPGPDTQLSSHHWPAAVSLTRIPSRATLVMFLHPHCPCSRASLSELAILLAHASRGVCADVVFVAPRGAPADWAETDLWKSAGDIPGVDRSIDRDGVEARIFGVLTSGATVVYDASGNLLFSGGITASRGHEGDNAGVDAILSALRGGPHTFSTTRVFGCALFGSSDDVQGGTWPKSK